MGLFNKTKPKIIWTKQTAPKIKTLEFDLSSRIYIPDTYSTTTLGKINITKQLLVNTDSSKENIKKELQDIVESIFSEIETFIDNNQEHFSNEFWTNYVED